MSATSSTTSTSHPPQSSSTTTGSFSPSIPAASTSATPPPTHIPYTWPKLNLNDCLLDPPAHRKAIEQAEHAASQFETQLRSVMKLVKANLEFSKSATDKHHAFTSDLLKHSIDISNGELQFNSFINRLNDEFNMYQEIQHQYLSLSQHLLINSISDYIATYFTPLKDLKKKFDNVTETLDSALDKYLAKKYNDPSIPELARDVADLRLLFHQASLDYCTQLNTIYFARKPDWMQRIYEWLGITNSFHSQTFHLFKQLMTPRVANFTAVTIAFKSKADLEIQTQDKLKSRLLNACANTYNPLNKGLFDTIKAVNSPPSSPTPDHIQSPNSGDPDTADDEPVLKSGYLLKRNQAQRMRVSWSRRYFIIRGELLVYQQREKEPEPIVAVNLRFSTVKPIDPPSSERRFTFSVTSANKTYVLQAENEEDMNGWIDALQKGINDALQSSNPPNTHGMSNKGKKEALAAAAAGTASASEVSPSIMNANRALAAQKQILARIRAVEGNMRCADCGHEDPEWCSINLGIVLCIECSGIHRSFGTSVSKVRSLILDKWDPDNIECMVLLGNAKMNQVYMRLCTEPVLKHTTAGGRGVRETYLRRKYVAKEWVSRDAIIASACISANASTPISIHEALWNAVCHSSGDLSRALSLYLIGADLNWQHPEFEFRTCLHQVIRAKDSVAAEFIFQLGGCNVDLQDRSGWAPLHYAAETCNNQLAHRLIRRCNANWELKDTSGRTALDIAIMKEDPVITTMLRLVELDAHAGFSKLGITEALSDTNASKTMPPPTVTDPRPLPTPQQPNSTNWPAHAPDQNFGGGQPSFHAPPPANNYAFPDIVDDPNGFANFPPIELPGPSLTGSPGAFAASRGLTETRSGFAAAEENPWG